MILILTDGQFNTILAQILLTENSVGLKSVFQFQSFYNLGKHLLKRLIGNTTHLRSSQCTKSKSNEGRGRVLNVSIMHASCSSEKNVDFKALESKAKIQSYYC